MANWTYQKTKHGDMFHPLVKLALMDHPLIRHGDMDHPLVKSWHSASPNPTPALPLINNAIPYATASSLDKAKPQTKEVSETGV